MDTVVLVLVVAGSCAGLSAGMKPWRRTSWSSSASSHHCRLSGEARWRSDEAVCCAAHPVMRVVRPPAAAGKSGRPSETESKVILMGHEIVKLLCPALVYSKGFFMLILVVLLCL